MVYVRRRLLPMSMVLKVPVAVTLPTGAAIPPPNTLINTCWSSIVNSPISGIFTEKLMN